MKDKKYENPCLLKKKDEGRDGNPCLIRTKSIPLIYSWERPKEREAHPEVVHNPCAPKKRTVMNVEPVEKKSPGDTDEKRQ